MKEIKGRHLLAVFAICMIATAGLSQEPAEMLIREREVVEGGKTRRVTLMEDRDQDYMTTKVYEVQNMKADDLRPFVEGAVRRANGESSVSRLNYSSGKKQYLQVNMPIFMVPYIDDMVQKLDRPGVKDATGAVIAGTGIHHFYYRPNHRSSQTMLDIIRGRYGSGDDIQYRDAASNLFYWKGSASDGKDVGDWLVALDRPVPQMEVRVKLHQISEDNLIELGIDWVALKNGPGAELFGLGLDYLDFQHFADVSSWSNMLDVSNLASFTSPGIFIAPNIDMTFLRLLNQKGRSRVATSNYLTITNDQSTTTDATFGSASPANFAAARYRIRFNPVFQTIAKDNNEISIQTTQPGISLYFVTPTIGHNNTDNPTDSAFLNFGYVLEIDNAMNEQTATGDRIQDNYRFRSRTSVAANSEKLLATYVKHHKVNQNNGVPFLSDIPILKYVFGSTADSMKKYRYYVTLEASPIQPDRNWGQWAGEVVNAQKMLEAYAKSNETATLPVKETFVRQPQVFTPGSK